MFSLRCLGSRCLPSPLSSRGKLVLRNDDDRIKNVVKNVLNQANEGQPTSAQKLGSSAEMISLTGDSGDKESILFFLAQKIVTWAYEFFALISNIVSGLCSYVFSDQDLRVCNDSIAPRGIPNLGNSCFMNAAMQVLIANPQFLEKINQNDIPGYEKLKKKLVSKVSDGMIDQVEFFFTALNTAGLDGVDEEIVKANMPLELDNTISRQFTIAGIDYLRMRRVTQALKNFLSEYQKVSDAENSFFWSGPQALCDQAYQLLWAFHLAGVIEDVHGQQDPVALIGFILDAIDCVFPVTLHREKDQFTLVRTTPDTMLQVPMFSNIDNFQDLMDQFCAPSLEGGGENIWEPKDGVKISQWEEKIRINADPPQYLPIQLKRFEEVNGAFCKNNKEINFNSLEVDLSSLFNNKAEKVNYEIVGAICHSGSLNSGHYISVVKKEGRWFVCNDREVRETDNPGKYVNTNGYVLFLKLKEPAEWPV